MDLPMDSQWVIHLTEAVKINQLMDSQWIIIFYSLWLFLLKPMEKGNKWWDHKCISCWYTGIFLDWWNMRYFPAMASMASSIFFDDQSAFKISFFFCIAMLKNTRAMNHRKAPSNFRIYINIHKLLQSCRTLKTNFSVWDHFPKQFLVSPRRHVLATYMTSCPGKAQSQHPQRYVWDSTASKEIKKCYHFVASLTYHW